MRRTGSKQGKIDEKDPARVEDDCQVECAAGGEDWETQGLRLSLGGGICDGRVVMGDADADVGDGRDVSLAMKRAGRIRGGGSGGLLSALILVRDTHINTLALFHNCLRPVPQPQLPSSRHAPLSLWSARSFTDKTLYDSAGSPIYTFKTHCLWKSDSCPSSPSSSRHRSSTPSRSRSSPRSTGTVSSSLCRLWHGRRTPRQRYGPSQGRHVRRAHRAPPSACLNSLLPQAWKAPLRDTR